MPRYEDHPIRLRRIKAGIGQTRLAQLTNLNRSTISAIEEGRVRNPDAATVDAIAAAVGTFPEDLQRELFAWWAAREADGPLLGPVAKATLAGGAKRAKEMRSFAHWRSLIAPSPTALASMLGLNPAVVTGYERGIRLRGMPETLQHALVARLNVDNEMLLALMALEPNHE